MITEVIIRDNTNTPVRHLSEVFDNGTEFKFGPGLNLILGNNGSGKSTLLELLAGYALCTIGTHSDVTTGSYGTRSTLFGINESLRDGADVKSDWVGSVFRLRSVSDFKGDEEVNKDISSFRNYVTSVRSSTGESVFVGIQTMMKDMFSGEYSEFPRKRVLADYPDLAGYYERNRDKSITQQNFRWTILMDEPDRNLDIDNILEIYKFLSADRPDTQIIVVLHNPVLILKLIKNVPGVTVIELTRRYTEKLKKFLGEDYGNTKNN